MTYERPGSQILWAVHHSEGPPTAKASCQPVGKDVSTGEPKELTQSNDKRIFQNRDIVPTEAAPPKSDRNEAIEVCASEAEGNSNSETQRKKQNAQACGADTTRWVVSPSVRSTYAKNRALLRDTKNGDCYILNRSASRVWVTIEQSPSGIEFDAIVDALESHFPEAFNRLHLIAQRCLAKLQSAGLVMKKKRTANDSGAAWLFPCSPSSRAGQFRQETERIMAGKSSFVQRLETLESLVDRIFPEGVENDLDWRTRKLKNFIDNAAGKISEDLGHICSQLELSLSDRQARRLFRQAAGVSMKDYARKRRLACAAKRLQSADEPIKVIATDAGYHTYYGFGKAFYEMFQLTPVEFRRFWQRAPGGA